MHPFDMQPSGSRRRRSRQKAPAILSSLKLQHQRKWLSLGCFWWVFFQCSPLPMATAVAGLALMLPSIAAVMLLEQWVELVDMEICTAKAMEQTQRHWAQHCSTMVWAVAHAMRLSASMTIDGVCRAPLWSQPPTSALQTTLCPTTPAGGATLLSSTLISLSLSSSALLSTELELFLSLTEGKVSSFYPLRSFLWGCVWTCTK